MWRVGKTAYYLLSSLLRVMSTVDFYAGALDAWLSYHMVTVCLCSVA